MAQLNKLRSRQFMAGTHAFTFTDIRVNEWLTAAETRDRASYFIRPMMWSSWVKVTYSPFKADKTRSNSLAFATNVLCTLENSIGVLCCAIESHRPSFTHLLPYVRDLHTVCSLFRLRNLRRNMARGATCDCDAERRIWPMLVESRISSEHLERTSIFGAA